MSSSKPSTRSGKKLLWVIGAGFFLLVLALWIGPRFIDWSGFKPGLSRLIANQYGVEVSLNGNLGIELLPQPKITIADVVVSGSGPQGTIRWLRGEINPAALIFGQLEPRNLSVVEANLTIPVDTLNLVQSRPRAVIRIEDSNIQFSHPAEFLPDQVNHIDGEIFLSESPGEILAFRGDARLQDQPVGLSLEILRGGNQRLAIAHAPSSSDLVLSTQVAENGALTGTFSLNIEEAGFLSTLEIEALTRMIGAGQAFAEGRLTYSSQSILQLDLDIIETSRVSGAGHLAYISSDNPAVDVKLNLEQVIFADEVPNRVWFERDIEQALHSLSEIDLTAEVTANLIRLGDQQYRHMALSFAASDAVAVLDRASLVLPGNVALSVYGSLDSVDEGWQFTGEGTLSGSDLRKALTPLIRAGDEVWSGLPDHRLRNADILASIHANTNHLTLSQISGRIDDTNWQGEISISAPSPEQDQSENYSFHAVLEADRINLDRYLDGGLLNVPSNWIRAGFDRDIVIFARNTMISGIPLSGAALSLSSAAEELPIMDFLFDDLAGASGSISVRLDEQGGAALSSLATVTEVDRFAGALGLEPSLASYLQIIGKSEIHADMSYAFEQGIGFALAVEGEGGTAGITGTMTLGSGSDPLQIKISDGYSHGPDWSILDIDGECGVTTPLDLTCNNTSFTLPGLTFHGDIGVSDAGGGATALQITSKRTAVDVGVYAEMAELPIVPEGTLFFTGDVVGEGRGILSTLKTMNGVFEFDGLLGLRLARNARRHLGAVANLRDNLNQAFGERAPAHGSITLAPGSIHPTINIEGEGADITVDGDYNLARDTLSAELNVMSDSNQVLLNLRANGNASQPSLRVNGPWISTP